MVGDCGGGLWWGIVVGIFFYIYISFLIIWRDYVLCLHAIIKPITFPMKADLLIF